MSLQQAVKLALAGDWHGAHNIAQDIESAEAHWVHAVLHKIEGDEWNSRYWYKRSGHEYEEFTDPQAELRAIAQQLNAD